MLGVAKDANERDIKKIFRNKAREMHPDKFPQDRKWNIIMVAAVNLFYYHAPAHHTLTQERTLRASKYNYSHYLSFSAEQEQAEKAFRELSEAHQVLTDPEKRRKYDNGEDLEQVGAIESFLIFLKVILFVCSLSRFVFLCCPYFLPPFLFLWKH